VHLNEYRGFDTEIGSQADIEFSGTEVKDGAYLLSAKGIVNQFLSGFFHFYLDLLVRPRRGSEGGPEIIPQQCKVLGDGSRTELATGYRITF
jgi:hypothetical protein